MHEYYKKYWREPYIDKSIGKVVKLLKNYQGYYKKKKNLQNIVCNIYLALSDKISRLTINWWHNLLNGILGKVI